MDVVEQALRDSRANELFQEISKEIQVEFRLTGGGKWGSNVEHPGQAVIYAAPTSMPAAALAHELLHLRTQLLGYRRLRVRTSLTESGDLMSRLLSALDNELQHHRMFAEYVRRGFPSSCFYADDDTETESYLWQEVKSKTGLRSLLVPFLSLIAPGGQLRMSAKRKLRHAFAKAGGEEDLIEVEKVFTEWSHQTDLNGEEPVRAIFKLLDPGSKTWLGYGEAKDFPRNGFFVGEAFTVTTGGK